MTAEEYRARGYNVSRNIAQTAIDAAEDYISRAYLVPVTGGKEIVDYDEDEKRTLAALVFLQMLQANGVFATRAGAKTTAIESSADASSETIMHAAFARARFELESLAKNYNVKPWKVVSDVCRLYFSTNYR